MEETFNDYVYKKFPTDNKRGTSGVIHIELGRKIKDCLRNSESFSTQFRHYVRKKKFRTFDLPSIGLKDVLTIPKPDNKSVSISYIFLFYCYVAIAILISCNWYMLNFQIDDNSLLHQHYRVVYVEEFYDTIKQIHCDELLHVGYRKTFEKVAICMCSVVNVT